MLKRIFSFFILCIFLAHFAGFYVYFAVQLKQVRREMRAKLKELPPEKLEVLILSPSEFEKAKVEEHEIQVHGKMFDIVRIELQDDRVFVHCLHDAAEDDLLAFLDKIISLPLKDKNVPASVLQFLSLNYLPTHWNFSTPGFHIAQSFTPYTEIISQFASAEITPPPKV